MTIRQQINDDLFEAMKARQSEVVSTLRVLLGEIDNAEAVDVDTNYVPMSGRSQDVPRRTLTENDIRQILLHEANNHREAIAEFEQVGRLDAAENLKQGLAIIESYLR